MIYKLNAISVVVSSCLLFLVSATIHAQTPTESTEQPPAEVVEVVEVVELPIVEPVDEIALKQNEMRDTIVLVTTQNGSGSGTIIDQLETEEEGVYEYRVLTNSHVTYSRFKRFLKGVDGITGKLDIQIIDTGCGIIVFDYENQAWATTRAEVIAENNIYDLSLLSFKSKDVLPVARVADDQMLSQVRVFDDVFAIGCQLGRAPTPTSGIISQIMKGTNGRQEWVIYGTTSEITPGSSGGGLFKKYDGHYYLIGIPYKIAVAGNGQMIPHLAHAISIITARNFLDENAVTGP